MQGGGLPVLAVYDFRSKQEFIYRTNRMREITGASELLAGMYERLLGRELPGYGIIANTWRAGGELALDSEGLPIFAEGEAGIVVYEGGGNLCVIYRNRDVFVAANRVFSREVLECAWGLSMVVGGAEWEPTGYSDSDFDLVRRRAYRDLDMKKRMGSQGMSSAMVPFTQVDAVTYQPIVERRYKGADRVEVSRESVCKLDAFQQRAKADAAWLQQGRLIDEIGTEEGDSLIAVVYFDGNSIGDRLMNVHGVGQMRSFSLEVHDVLVVRTEAAMKRAIEAMPDERHRSYRVVIDHGDEITLICNAHAAPIAIEAYFDALDKANESLGVGDHPYRACAGVAFCHAHDPFREVYRIAEELCESGKIRNRREMVAGHANANYVDFHFCRSGITGSLEQMREAQEGGLTNRPFRFDGESREYQTFCEVGRLLAGSKIKRSDLKELARAILRGDSWYGLECERLRAKDAETWKRIEALVPGGRSDSARRNLLFDVTGFWDVFDVLFTRQDEGEVTDNE